MNSLGYKKQGFAISKCHLKPSHLDHAHEHGVLPGSTQVGDRKLDREDGAVLVDGDELCSPIQHPLCP